MGSSGSTISPRPPASVSGKPSTRVPTTGTPSPMARTAACENASSREGQACTDAPATHGAGSATQPHRRTTSQARRGDTRAQRRLEHAGAQGEHRRRRGHLCDRLDEHVGALVRAQAPGEHDPRRRQPGTLRGAEALDGRHAAHHALLAHPHSHDARPGARAVGVEAVDAAGDLGHRGPLRLPGPGEVVVLAGRQRHPARDGVPRRPPRAEHVRVHHVGAGQPRLEPGGERRVTAPLQVLLGAHELGHDAMRAGQRHSRVRREAHQQARPMPARRQRPRHAQQRELGPSRLQLGDDPSDEHTAAPYEVTRSRHRPAREDATQAARRATRAPEHRPPRVGNRPERPAGREA